MILLSEASELTVVKALLAQLGTSPQKALGQNFLINESVIAKIVEYFEIKNKKVIEIGPGLGALTRKISLQTPFTTLIELDKKIISFWQEKGYEVLGQDALKVNWKGFLPDQNILISNLPYQISAPLVIELSVQKTPIDKMVLMFQKEVAQRIQSLPNRKSYGIISVVAQNVWTLKKVADLSARDFYPSPKVESRVLAFEAKSDSAWVSKKFLTFVKHCFQNRRKLLLNKLVTYAKSKGMSKDQVLLILASLKIPANARAENLEPQAYKSLFLELNKA